MLLQFAGKEKKQQFTPSHLKKIKIRKKLSQILRALLKKKQNTMSRRKNICKFQTIIHTMDK